MDIIEIFCKIDDFCNEFLPKLEKTLLSNISTKKHRKSSLSTNELMNILVMIYSYKTRCS